MKKENEDLRLHEIATILETTVDGAFKNVIPRVSPDSLNKMKKRNPEKYRSHVLGVLCTRYDIKIEDVLKIIKEKKKEEKNEKDK